MMMMITAASTTTTTSSMVISVVAVMAVVTMLMIIITITIIMKHQHSRDRAANAITIATRLAIARQCMDCLHNITHGGSRGLSSRTRFFQRFSPQERNSQPLEFRPLPRWNNPNYVSDITSNFFGPGDGSDGRAKRFWMRRDSECERYAQSGALCHLRGGQADCLTNSVHLFAGREG